MYYLSYFIIKNIIWQCLIKNSSEYGPFRDWPIRAQQKFSRPIRIEHLGQVTKLTSQCPYLGMKTTWPHGIMNTRTQGLDPHFSHSFNDNLERRAWITSGTSQTMKNSPSPFASQKSRKTHTVVEWKKSFLWFNEKTNLEPGWQAGRVWRPSDVTPLTLIGEHKKGCLTLGGRSHERWMRPFDIVVETCEWPRFD